MESKAQQDSSSDSLPDLGELSGNREQEQEVEQALDFGLEQDLLSELVDVEGEEEDTVQAMEQFNLEYYGSKVLVVDDNLTNLRSTSVILSGLGVSASLAQSGKLALEMIESRRAKGEPGYDVIFLDFQMLGMSGPQTSKAIRSLLGQVPRRSFAKHKEPPLVCGMTALSHQSLRSLATEAGMDILLLKPINLDDYARSLNLAGVVTSQDGAACEVPL